MESLIQIINLKLYIEPLNLFKTISFMTSSDIYLLLPTFTYNLQHLPSSREVATS